MPQRTFAAAVLVATIVARSAIAAAPVTGCWVDAKSAVINGPSTYITLVEKVTRPHVVRLERAPGWTQSIVALDNWRGAPDAYVAPDYDTLADSPLVA